MKINEILTNQKSSILKRWFKAIIDSYPAESGQYLSNTSNKFSNPIGVAIENALPPILDAVISNTLSEDAEKGLEDIIKIRAVQEVDASDALGFIFSLKAILISDISSYLNTDDAIREFFLLEKSLDAVTLYSFNQYVKLRENIFQIKSNERLKTFEKMINRLNDKYEELTARN